jgi:hypothetical protein
VSRSVLWLAVATAALGAALLLAPGTASTWVHVYLVVVGALVLARTVVVLARREADAPSIVDPALVRRTVEPGRPEDLEQLERLVSIGSGSAYDLHYRLRPALVTIAEGILHRRGIDLETQPDGAHAALGDDAWALLRPHRPPPSSREAPALTTRELEGVVEALEQAR